MATRALAAKYRIENDRLRVEVVTRTFSVNVVDRKTGQAWRMDEEPFEEVVVERSGVVTKETLAGASDAVAHLFGGAALFEFPSLRLRLLVMLEDNRLSFELSPLEENERFRIRGACWPRGFRLSKSSGACLVAPFEQGVMIPGDWPEEASFGELRSEADRRMKAYSELFGRNVLWWTSQGPGYSPALATSILMPWWGAVERKGSVLAVLDENCWADSHLAVTHPAGGPTRWTLAWLPTKGRLGYPRRVTYHFIEGGYVELAAAYRAVAESRGKCVTLREKRDANPKMDKLVGAVNLGLRFMAHSAQRYEHKVLMTFAEAADKVEEFRRKTGIERLHVAARGWQQHGHDIQYPDLVPPSPECGGPVEFDKLASRVQRAGCAFGLGGDNYYDVALDSPLFDESMLLRFEDGSINRRNFWASGLTSMICTKVAIKYLRRNFEVGRTDYPATPGLLETAHPDTYWIGNYISSLECFDPRHPMTRTTCWDAQREIFQYINACGLLLNNEHPLDWAAPFFYMARTRQARSGVVGYDRSGDTVAVPVPLWSLVYHDCLIPGGDNALLQMMNGAPPSMSLDQADDAKLVERTKLHAALHRAVMFDAMTGHRFLSPDRSVQETEFSGGVTVLIDTRRGSAKVEGVSGLADSEILVGEPGKNYY